MQVRECNIANHASAARDSLAKALAIYGVASLLTVLIVVGILQPWKADPGIPYYYLYGNDASWTAMLVKSIVDHGWFEHNPSLGAPFGLFHEDFPLPENLHFLIIRGLAIFTRTPGLVLNAFFVLTFPLTTVAALYVFRRFGVSVLSAIGASMLYALLPAHFLRGEIHLMLAAYYLVPLMVMVCLWVCEGIPIGKRPEVPIAIAICALMGAGGVYYAFFGCVLLIVAAFIAFSRDRSRRILLAPMILFLVLGASQAINLAPSVFYRIRHGPNPAAVLRDPSGGERYSLRLSQLLLPLTDHRWRVLAGLKRHYNALLGPDWSNENDWSTLGLIGSCGFLLLLGALFWSPVLRAAPLLGDLAALNLGALALSTASGFGPILTFLFLYNIRCWNRISVFIAFFSFFAIAIAADRIRLHYSGSRWRSILFAAILTCCVAGGIFEQTSAAFTPEHKKLREKFYADDWFVRDIERTVAPGAMIFQLPYTAFPEGDPAYKMAYYDSFLPYLHSRTLRWSYGTMKGRPGDLWYRHTAGLPLPELVDTLAFAGFSGIYIDRVGFENGAGEIIRTLSQLLEIAPHLHPDGRAAFFDLSAHTAKLRLRIPAGEWERRQDQALHPEGGR